MPCRYTCEGCKFLEVPLNPFEQLWTGRDVSRLIDLLGESRQQLRHILDLVPLGVAMLAPDLTVTFANRRFLELFPQAGGGQALDRSPQLQGLNLGRAVAEVLTNQARGRARAETREGRAVELTLEPLLPNVLVLAEAGNAEAADRPHGDLSVEPRTKQLLDDRAAEAAQRVCGYVAHHMNNLLTVALSYSEIVLRRFGSAQSLRSDMEQVLESLRQAAEISGQLLTLSSGRPQSPQPVALGRFLSGLQTLIENVADRRVQIGIPAALKTIEVNADPSELENALLTLVSEARDLSPSGTISLQARRPGDPIMSGSGLVLDRPHAGITVSFESADLTAEEVDHLFEPFYEVRGRASVRFPIVHSIIRRMGGQVSVMIQGSTTIFCIALPVLNP